MLSYPISPPNTLPQSPNLWDCGAHLQPELEAGEGSTNVENTMRHVGAKDAAPKGSQQLQASGADITPDEETGMAGPRPFPTSGGTIHASIAVHLPVWHQGG